MLSSSHRTLHRWAARGLLWAAALVALPAQAALVMAAGPFVINYGALGGAPVFSVSGRVDTGGVGFIYTYRVENLTGLAQNSEFLIVEHVSHRHFHHEVAPTVNGVPGGLLFHDAVGAVVLGINPANYHWTDPALGGLSWTPHQTILFSFEDVHGPALEDWGLYDPGAALAAFRFKSNVMQGVGQLPVPDPDSTVSVAEPTSLLLCAIGLLGVAASRRTLRARAA